MVLFLCFSSNTLPFNCRLTVLFNTFFHYLFIYLSYLSFLRSLHLLMLLASPTPVAPQKQPRSQQKPPNVSRSNNKSRIPDSKSRIPDQKSRIPDQKSRIPAKSIIQKHRGSRHRRDDRYRSGNYIVNYKYFIIYCYSIGVFMPL